MSAATAARWSRTSRPPWSRSIANARAWMRMRGYAGSRIWAPKIATCWMCGRAADAISQLVVPAKAGTPNHRCLLLRPAAAPASLNNSRWWLWVLLSQGRRVICIRLRRLRRRAMRMLVDRIDNLRPHRDRQRVAHAFDHQKLGARDRGRGVLAAFGAHQRIDGAVHHQRRRLHRSQPFLAAAGGEDHAELPSDACGINTALKGALGPGAMQRLGLR